MRTRRPQANWTDRVMYWILILFCGGVTSALAADGAQGSDLQSSQCNNNECASVDILCDSTRGCAGDTDNDQVFTPTSMRNAAPEELRVRRDKRQAACGKEQWRCRDGSCISSNNTCDGARHCPDRSDETHALCRGNTCQSEQFRCTYGACVDGTSACNGVSECADGSDEMQPRCFNDTHEAGGKFKCQHGPSIDALRRCDGVTDCDDGSDETVRACADVRCPSFTFQCAYGACVDQGSECDGKRDCPDGSDEDVELCGRGRTSAPTPAPSEQGPCMLPPRPDHGSYVVTGSPDAQPEDVLANFTLEYTCDTGYAVIGKHKISCSNGSWTYEKPQCLRLCRLDPHPSVEYMCLDANSDTTRPCDRDQASGAQVLPRCRSPDYYSRQILSPMKCIEGSWDYIAICRPDCGRMSVDEREFSMRLKVRNELPWHVRVYGRRSGSYKQICGGTIISSKTVVSAARCFRSGVGEGIQPGAVRVAAGKTYQSWDDARDYDTETRDVAEIKIHPGFRGAQTDYQNDIALLTLSEPLPYKSYIRPVCIDFDESFERQQLQRGTMARVASRVFSSEGGVTLKSLKVVELPYVIRDECSTRAARKHRKYFTDDKICAGSDNETTACTRDNGAGLAFLDSNSEEKRYYLRGVLSVPAKACESYRVVSFTSISRQELFIKDHIDSSLIGRVVESGACRLPPYPEHGGYAVSGRADARPGDTFEAFYLNYTCDSGYGIVGKREIYCFNGYWPHKTPHCIECGLVTPAGRALIIDGAPAMRPELPWHVGVYRRDANGTHEQICGGTIVSNTVVVSAAHCFWSDLTALLPASRFAIAAGKLHRDWASPGDPDAQTRDVAEIKIPSRFRGALTSFQDDIALVVLSSPLDYQTYVRPVCISFDERLEKKHLRSGHLGKVAGWGYTSESGHSADTLRVATLPYVDIDRCLAQAPPTFYQYITSDKICAGYTNGTALCMGDSGGGLVFPKISRKVTRYYLRGVVSTAPNNERACNAYAITSFTQITKHESFIRQTLGDIFL